MKFSRGWCGRSTGDRPVFPFIHRLIGRSSFKASLRRHPKSPHFIACFTDKAGRRRQRSTRVKPNRTVNARRKAQKIADDDVARGLRTAIQSQHVIQDLYQEANGEPLEQVTTADFAKQWMADKKGSVSSKTEDTYAKRLKSLLDSLGQKTGKSMHLISSRDVRDWRDIDMESKEIQCPRPR